MTRKLDVAGVFERIFEIYRDQFTLLITAALVVFVPVAIVNGLIFSGGVVAAFLIAALLAIVATFLFQGMVVEAARDILDGRRDHTVESLLRAALPVLGPLVGAGLLAGIGIAIGLVLVIVPGLFLLTIWAVIVPVIVLERVPAMQSFGRSRELVRGSGWQVFGVIVVLFLLQIVLGSLVNAIFGAISDTFVVRSIGDLIVRILVGPLSALAAAVMYFELKGIRGEAVPGSETYTPSAAPQPTPPSGEPQPGA